ncbi:hypothetical protein DENSPDRAFT_869721 [Dentipellis sp. KUC8613]|nr:hypothetical protein DENSPDRAFT_869721 [Dentipellis sp. KUC8613]
MNKDSDKGSKKSKENSSRRLSAVAVMQSGTARSRPSMGEKPSSIAPKDATPASGSATITRASRRQSAIIAKTNSDSVSEDGVLKPTRSSSPKPSVTANRKATLRPRNPPTSSSSALPKYRPKSQLGEPPAKPPSPTRPSTRRRLSSSSDDAKQDAPTGKKTPPKLDIPSSQEKVARPISPLPQRALKTNTSINVSPPTPVSKSKVPSRKTPSPTRNSPSMLPTKAAKTSKITSPNFTAIVRPPSSSSSSSSVRSPRTPQTPTPVRDAKGRLGSTGTNGSPLRHPGAHRAEAESPLGRRMKKTPGSNVMKGSPSTPTSTFTADSSADSLDARDVDFLLGSVISPTAPTPAVPRFRTSGRAPSRLPETPSRVPTTLPTRANMSYLSPNPRPRDESPSKAKRAGNDRGSLLSWDQLFAVGEQSLGEAEGDSMIADMTAPFSGAASPVPSVIELDIPDSPSLSALPSPAGYGSISQVLLPDVTPSPAKYGQATPERSTVDASVVMMLRLQLASMENIAKERLGQIQSLEQKLMSSKDARLREADELARQVTTVEEQLRVSLESRDRASDEQLVRIRALEDQLGQATAMRDAAVQEAVQMAVEGTMQLKAAAVRVECEKWEMACAARAAAAEWATVKDLADGELELVRSNREMLNVLLAGLEGQRRLCS